MIQLSSTTYNRPRKYIKPGRTQFLRTEKNETLDEKLIIRMIQELNKTHKKLSIRSLGISREPTIDPILTKCLEKPCSRKFLYHMACQHFGSWNLALVASGVEPIKPSYNRLWNSELILKSIKQLHKANHALTVQSIWRDRSRKTTSVLFEVTEKRTTGSALHDAARRYFGSWDIALSKAGVKVERIKERPFWTKTKIIWAIQTLHKENIPLNSKTLSEDERLSTKRLIQQKLGKGRTGRSLLGAGYRYFGSWDRALSESGISVDSVRKNKFTWKKHSVARILKILHEFEVPINASSISKDCSNETREIIYNYTGKMEQGTNVYRLGNKTIGHWDEVLKYSGFKISQIRRSGSPCERNPERVIEFIRLFSKHEYALNRTSIAKYSHFMKILMEDHYGSAVSGMSLFKTAHSLFGSWDEALWTAGLDPSSIRLRSRPHTSALPVALHQIEDVKVDGELRHSRFLGAPSKSPEQLLEDKENASSLLDAVASLPKEDQALAEQVFDVILKIHHYKNQDDLIKHVAQHLGNRISEIKIREIFLTLSKSIDSLS